MNSKGWKKLFVKEDPKELVRKWQTSLRRETRGVERQIRGALKNADLWYPVQGSVEIRREQKKAEQAVREAAKRGDVNSVRLLAKELAQTKRAVTQLHSNRAHIMAMQVALTEQLAVLRVSGTIKRSTEIMDSMSKLLKVPAMMKISQELAREMEKAGLIEEMVMDAFDEAVDEEDLEEETEAEVQKVLAELAGEIKALPTPQQPVAVETAAEPEEEVPPDLEVDALQSRLDAIRN